MKCRAVLYYVAMSDAQFSQFLMEDASSFITAKAAAIHIGEPSDSVWVLNKTTHINKDGEK